MFVDGFCCTTQSPIKIGFEILSTMRLSTFPVPIFEMSFNGVIHWRNYNCISYCNKYSIIVRVCVNDICIDNERYFVLIKHVKGCG